MENKTWQEKLWIVVKVIFWLFVISAVTQLIWAALRGMANFAADNTWITYVLFVAFWVGVYYYNKKKDS